jgi:osomolarity two-component system sensor histidine kinase NIK1
MSLAISTPHPHTAGSSLGKMLNSVGSDPSSSSNMGYMSRTTSTPLPDFNSLPSDFIDHLLLVTQAIVNTKSVSYPTQNGDAKINGSADADATDIKHAQTAIDDKSEGNLTLPLPKFSSSEADERTRQIEANLHTLVDRLWRTEDQLAMSSDHDKKAFPYPLSQAHPQSSSYPLSYPLGFDNSGPVLLTPAKQGEEEVESSPEGAVGAFERYNDESGLSAQEELRLLKAQVQDIARVCKVRCSISMHDEQIADSLYYYRPLHLETFRSTSLCQFKATSWWSSRTLSIRWSIDCLILLPK